MKTYIKSTIKPYKTLKDWIDENQNILDPDTDLVILDGTPYPDYFRTAIAFEGKFYNLLTGTGQFNGFKRDDYSFQDYLNRLDSYELDEIEEMQGDYLAIKVFYSRNFL